MESAKKELVLNAVFESIMEAGDVSKITVSEIAKRAGIGKGSVYMYFASKEQMISEAARHLVETTMPKILDYPLDDKKDFKQLMTGFIKAHIEVTKKYSNVFYAATGSNVMPQLTSDLRESMMELIVEIKDKYRSKILKIIELGKKEEVFKGDHCEFDLLAVSHMLFATAGHFAQREVPVICDNVDEYAQMMYDMSIRMLNKPD